MFVILDRPASLGAQCDLVEALDLTLALAASMAKAYASDAGWRVCTASLQVHGGIGFTWEHDLHFFLKRAKVDGLLYGSARDHRDIVAQLSGSEKAASAA